MTLCLARHDTADGTDHFGISPRGDVPLPELDDGSRRRRAVVGWLTFVGTELHKMFSPWLWHQDTAESTRQAAKCGVADACASTIVGWAHFLALPLTRHPHLQADLKRVSGRPRVQDAPGAERLLT